MDSGASEDLGLKRQRQPVAFKPSQVKTLPGNVATLKRRQERIVVGQTNRVDHPGPVPHCTVVAEEKSKPENEALFKHNGYKSNLVYVARRTERPALTSPMAMTAPLLSQSLPYSVRQLEGTTTSEQQPSSAPFPTRKLNKTKKSTTTTTAAAAVPAPTFLSPLRPKLRMGCTVYPDTHHIAEPSTNTALYAPPEVRFHTGVLDKFDLTDVNLLQKRRYDFKINRRIQNEARVIETYHREEAEHVRALSNRALTFAYSRLKYFERLKEIENKRDKTSRIKPLLVPAPAASMASLGGGANTGTFLHRPSGPAPPPPPAAITTTSTTTTTTEITVP